MSAGSMALQNPILLVRLGRVVSRRIVLGDYRILHSAIFTLVASLNGQGNHNVPFVMFTFGAVNAGYASA
jgi:hypothetical protein